MTFAEEALLNMKHHGLLASGLLHKLHGPPFQYTLFPRLDLSPSTRHPSSSDQLKSPFLLLAPLGGPALGTLLTLFRGCLCRGVLVKRQRDKGLENFLSLWHRNRRQFRVRRWLAREDVDGCCRRREDSGSGDGNAIQLLRRNFDSWLCR